MPDILLKKYCFGTVYALKTKATYHTRMILLYCLSSFTSIRVFIGGDLLILYNSIVGRIGKELFSRPILDTHKCNFCYQTNKNLFEFEPNIIKGYS